LKEDIEKVNIHDFNYIGRNVIFQPSLSTLTANVPAPQNTSSMKRTCSLGLLLLILTACSSEKKEEAIYPLPANAAEMLAGKVSKTWKLAKRTNGDMRVNMGECTLAYRQTFSANGQLTDNNAQNADCGPSLEGSWKLSLDSKGQTYLAITSELIPELFKVKEGSKTKYFKIVSLSDSLLVFRFPHQLFSNETTIIEDTLIPEDAPDGDRNFHW
jgi:hypothetical protein